MTESPGASGRFERRPRRQPAVGPHTDDKNFWAEIAKIADRLERVRLSQRQDFFDSSPSYDAATVAIIRLHVLLEREEFADYFDVLDGDELKGIRATRNIASHGYHGMNDDVFWATATIHAPAIISRLRSGTRN